MIHIAPSILTADFSCLLQQVQEAEKGGAQRLHVDVMDGHFVPNLSMGPVVVESLRPKTRLPLEVHLMVTNPQMFIEPFVKAGADTLIVHLEVLPDPTAALLAVRRLNKAVGLAINPETPVEKIEPFLASIDLALCMTVHPGFGGQKFITDSPERIQKLRQMINKHNPHCELEVDGGINHATRDVVVQAGANVLVVGSGIFSYPQGPAAAVRALLAS